MIRILYYLYKIKILYYLYKSINILFNRILLLLIKKLSNSFTILVNIYYLIQLIT